MRSLTPCAVTLLGIWQVVSSSVARAQPVEFEPGGPGSNVTERQDLLESTDVVLMASRRIQVVQEAPMIVTVLTREQIRQGGFRTIEEILRTVPGFEHTQFQNGRFQQMIARGQVRSLLFLLNGSPYYTFYYNTPLELHRTFDVQMIEKIEVVSGPGGSLWGANALLGIVNVITRDAPETGHAQEVTLGGGDGPGERDVLRAFARTSWRIGTLGSFNLMGSYLQTRGPEYRFDDTVYVDPGPFIWDANQSRYGLAGTSENAPGRFVTGIGTLTLGDFTLFGYVPYARYDLPVAPSGSLLSGDTIEDDKAVAEERFEPLAYLRFNWREHGDRLGIQVTASSQVHNETVNPLWIAAPAPPDIPQVPPGGLAFAGEDRVQRHGIAADFHATLSARNQLLWGVEVYGESGTERSRDLRPSETEWFENIPDSGRVVFTAFARDEWRLVDPLAVSGGVRYAGSDKFDPVILGDATAVWNITGKLYVRAAVTQGFRPPALEACCSIPTAATAEGNPDLDVERSTSFEGELNLVTLEDVGPFRRLYLRGDYAYTLLSGIIENQFFRYFNRGEQRVHTAEFLARLDLGNRSTATLAYSYFMGADERRGEQRIPANHILNFSFALRVLPWLDLTTVFTAVGPTEDANRISDLPQDLATMNSLLFDRLDPYFLWRPGLVVHDVPVRFVKNFELRVFADNVFNQRYFTADTSGNDKIESIPELRPGWSVFGDLTYRFGSQEGS